MHIEIANGKDGAFEVRVVDGSGHVLHRYIYRTIESARRAATTWTAAYDNCPIEERLDRRGRNADQ